MRQPEPPGRARSWARGCRPNRPIVTERSRSNSFSLAARGLLIPRSQGSIPARPTSKSLHGRHEALCALSRRRCRAYRGSTKTVRVAPIRRRYELRVHDRPAFSRQPAVGCLESHSPVPLESARTTRSRRAAGVSRARRVSAAVISASSPGARSRRSNSSSVIRATAASTTPAA
jgi:hypothetical protein